MLIISEAKVGMLSGGLQTLVILAVPTLSSEFAGAVTLGTKLTMPSLLSCTAAKVNNDGSLTINFVNGLPFVSFRYLPIASPPFLYT